MSTEILHRETKKALIPQLRFEDFKVDWNEIKLGDYIVIKSGNSPSSYNFLDGGTYPFIKVEELNNCDKYQNTSRFYSNENKNLVETFSVIFPKRGAAILNNKVRINDCPILMDSNMMAITPLRNKLYYEFLYYKIVKEELYKIADTSTIPQINNKHIEPYKLFIPSLPEQQKIASFLSAVDEKIQQLSRKKELLEQYKKGVMQQLFSGKLRFKHENGNEYPDWEKVNGNVLFESISNKNHKSDLPILAITQDQGAIPRDLIDYKVSVTDKSIDSYKVVEIGDFVISLRSFQGGIEYSNYKGICSPAYIILRPKSENVNKQFYKTYLKTSSYIKELQKNLEGIRDGKMISYKCFSDIKLPFPCFEEQQKIANFLSSIDVKIENTNQQINQMQNFKKGLLQQMFV